MMFLVAALVLVQFSLAEAHSEPSTYQILSLVDKTNPSGPHFVAKNFLSSNSVQWSPFRSFPLHRVIIV